MNTVVYHHSDLDGYASFWAFCTTHGYNPEDVVSIPIDYDDCQDVDLLALKGKDVFVFDYYFHPEIIEEMQRFARSFLLIDHHASALERIGDIEFCHIDTSNCGAVNVWKHFTDQPVPEFLKYVNMYDTWTFGDDANAKLICMAFSKIKPDNNIVWQMASDFYNWDGILLTMGNIERSKIEAKALELVKQGPAFYIGEEHGYIMDTGIPMFNISGISFIGSEYCRLTGEKAVGSFTIKGNTVSFSLRSEPGTDVRIPAEVQGGGGHPCASGFSMPLDNFLIDLASIRKHSK